MTTKKKKAKPDQPKAGSKPTSTQAGDVAGVGNVDQIRDILFGAQMRDYERKFTRIEERMLKESDRLREDTSKRLDALENYVEKEVESLGDRLKKEQAEREETSRELAGEQHKTAKAFEKKLNKLDDQLGMSARDFRQQILEQSKNLSEDIRKRTEETIDMLDRRAAELGNDKVDRNGLSELLTEMALRLSNGPSLGLDLDPDEFESE